MTSKQIEQRFDMFKSVVAILIALVLALIVIAFVSEAPLEAITAFAIGPLQRVSRMGEIVTMMTPYIFTGTAICLMYQANQFNMIGEGAFLIGANVSTLFLVSFPAWSALSLRTGALAVGFTVGVAAAFIPTFLKVRFKANAVVSSIMMNYILLQTSNYILYNLMRDTESGKLNSYRLPEQVGFDTIVQGTRIHAGIFIALTVALIAYLFIYRTKWGYAIRMVGANQNFAKYSGISVIGVSIVTQLVGGGIAGMGGAVEMMGMYDRFIWYGISPGYGFDGIMVGVLAKNNPLYVPFAAFFLAYLNVGADSMNRVSDVPVEFVSVIQAIIIMLVAAEMFLSKYKHKLIVSNAKKLEKEKEEANNG